MSDGQSDHVAVQDTGDVVYLAVLPRGPITVLEGSAMTIWRAAATGPIGGVTERVATAMGVDAEDIRESVDEFIHRLASQGLISQSS